MNNETQVDFHIIDTDLHNKMPDRKFLLPYLPKVWHQMWVDQGEANINMYSISGQVRKDADPPNGGPAGSDPHFILEHHIEKYNIDFAVCNGTTMNTAICMHYDPDYANAVASAYNDMLVENWLNVSPKFKGSILINASDPAAAAKEIDRIAGHPDMVQVIVSSAARNLYGQRFYHPIYEAAERNGLPIAMHPGVEAGALVNHPPTPAGYPTRYMEWHNVLPQTSMGHMNSLVCEGVFEKFPRLKFLVLEGGISWLPHLMWRMDKNYKGLRDSAPWLKQLPSEYIKQHFYLSTQPIEEPRKGPQDLVKIIEMIDASDMIVYSSDYPHWDFDNPEMVANRFPRELRKKVMATNAAELYGLMSKATDKPKVSHGTGGELHG